MEKDLDTYYYRMKQYVNDANNKHIILSDIVDNNTKEIIDENTFISIINILDSSENIHIYLKKHMSALFMSCKDFRSMSELKNEMKTIYGIIFRLRISTVRLYQYCALRKRIRYKEAG